MTMPHVFCGLVLYAIMYNYTCKLSVVMYTFVTTRIAYKSTDKQRTRCLAYALFFYKPLKSFDDSCANRLVKAHTSLDY